MSFSLDLSYPLESYTPERIQESILILHPKVLDRYQISLDEFHSVFERASNFSHLKYPIIDEFGNRYEDSEGYYMAQRFTSQNIKMLIAEASKIKGKSKNVAYHFEEEMNKNDTDRIMFMRNAIKKKFDNSEWRRGQLKATGTRDIIEFTYWGDEFFGISHDDRRGRNILGKLLIEYRDAL